MVCFKFAAKKNYIICELVSTEGGTVTVKATLGDKSADSSKEYKFGLFKFDGKNYVLQTYKTVVLYKGKWTDISFPISEDGQYGVAPYFWTYDKVSPDYACATQWVISA